MAVGYSDQQIMELVDSHYFRLIGISVSNSENIPECLKTAKYIKARCSRSIPIVLGGQGITNVKNKELYSVFDDITGNPTQALKLIRDQDYN